MSVENVPAVVNIKTLKGRFIAHKFSTGWAVAPVGVVKSVKKKKSVAGQFAVKYKHGCVGRLDQFSWLRFAKSRLRLDF